MIAQAPLQDAVAFRERHGQEAFYRALEIANDVISFDAHRVYLHFSDGSDTAWDFGAGYSTGEDAKDLQRSRDLDKLLLEQGDDETLIHPPTNEYPVGSRYLCLQKLRFPGGVTGYLGIARKKRGCFSGTERYQLRAVATLLTRAMEDTDGLDLLRRLHLHFLDQRTLLSEVSEQEVLDSYLGKAFHVIHPFEAKWSEQSPASEAPREQAPDCVRLTAKLPVDNNMALRIRAHRSSQPEEWVPELLETLYVLPDRTTSSPTESIAARCYVRRRTYRTNRYPHADIPSLRLFPDTQSHMTAAIVSGKDRSAGVLSVETTAHNSYRSEDAAVFTLIAAHLSRPLRRAIQRSAVRGKAQAFREVQAILRTQTGEEGLRTWLRDALSKLGYSRGMISEVNEADRRIVGQHAWGDDRMNIVRERTDRHIDRDGQDCQVIAWNTREPQIIRSPHKDERAHKPTVEAGDLGPFGIFPLVDNHDRVLWTVHVERNDRAPIGDLDKNLIRELCARMMKAREEERRTRFEREWYARMPGSLRSLKELLKAFAEFASDSGSGFVVRCRVYGVDRDVKQHPWHQAGSHQAEKFFSVELDHRDTASLQSPKPILFVRKNGKTSLFGSEEFEVRLDREEPHEDELLNRDRSQWVEAPINVRRRTVAKVVFDHTRAKSDAFTLGEMRLIAHLSRILSVAAECLDVRQSYGHLRQLGLVACHLWHHVSRSLDNLTYEQNVDLAELRTRINSANEIQSVFDGMFRDHRDHPPEPGGQHRRMTTLGEELALASRLFCTGLPEYIQVSFPNGDLSAAVPLDDHPLLLILLPLLVNAQKAIFEQRKAARGSDPGVDFENSKLQPHFAPSTIFVTLMPRSQPASLVLCVSDTGPGLSSEKEAEIRRKLAVPHEAIAEGQGSGLVYSAQLAAEYEWQLNLVSANPATFELVIPLQESRRVLP